MDRDTIAAWLDDGEDHWLTAAEILDIGLADGKFEKPAKPKGADKPPARRRRRDDRGGDRRRDRRSRDAADHDHRGRDRGPANRCPARRTRRDRRHGRRDRRATARRDDRGRAPETDPPARADASRPDAPGGKSWPESTMRRATRETVAVVAECDTEIVELKGRLSAMQEELGDNQWSTENYNRYAALQMDLRAAENKRFQAQTVVDDMLFHKPAVPEAEGSPGDVFDRIIRGGAERSDRRGAVRLPRRDQGAGHGVPRPEAGRDGPIPVPAGLFAPPDAAPPPAGANGAARGPGRDHLRRRVRVQLHRHRDGADGRGHARAIRRGAPSLRSPGVFELRADADSAGERGVPERRDGSRRRGRRRPRARPPRRATSNSGTTPSIPAGSRSRTK